MTRMTKLWRWDVLIFVLKAFALAMFIFHILVVTRMPMDVVQKQVIHLGFAFILIYGFQLKKDKPVTSLLYLVLLLASLVVLGYIIGNRDALEWRMGMPTQLDTVFGIILIISVLFASYKGWGPILPALVMVVILYALFGTFLPSALAAPPAKLGYTIASLSTSLTGIFSSLLTISVLYIFLFIIFGQLLGASGAIMLISEGGKWLSQRITSGSALTATIGSALVGMTTGSASANVFLTGSFTIPMMKKAGIRSDFAGAIEALASTGGQVMPPILGAAGFVMAYYIGVQYWDVVKVAWIPAFLWFISVGFGAHFYCKLKRLKPLAGEQQKLGLILRKGAIFLIGIAVLMILLMQRYTPAFAVSVSIVVILVVIFLESLFMRELRTTWRKLFDSIAWGARAGADIGMSLALLGMVTQVFASTGLGYRLGAVLTDLAGGNMLFGLVMLGILALILGTGLSTTPAYLVAAMVAGPGLIRMGLEPIVAHFFIFYMAVFSMVTPPVAASAMAASRLSGASFMRTAIAATRLAWPAFFVPFIFVYQTELLLQGGSLWLSVLSFLLVAVSIVFIQAASWGFLITRETKWERYLSILGPVAIIYYLVATPDVIFLILGLSLLALVTLSQLTRQRRARETVTP